jgi:hypothetical protein
MRKLFSGNADVVAVVAIVLTLGLASGLGHGFTRVHRVRDRVLTRVPAKMRQVPVRLRLAELRESHPVLKHVICLR